MKRFLATALVATSLAARTSTDTLAGTPITTKILVAQAELIRIADSIDAAVDAKNWALARSFFANDIRTDFTSLTGGAPAALSADALITGWSGNLTAEKTSFLLRGNHRITFEDDSTALMLSHDYAWNDLESGALPENGGEALWEVRGTYEHGFTLTDDGWCVNAMRFVVTAERRNAFVLCGWLPFCKSYLMIWICQKQSCVRPVSATHMAAGPDGFHQPSPIPQLEQQAFRTKHGASWF